MSESLIADWSSSHHYGKALVDAYTLAMCALVSTVAERYSLPRVHVEGFARLSQKCKQTRAGWEANRTCHCELCEDYGFLSAHDVAGEASAATLKAKRYELALATGRCQHVVSCKSRKKTVCNAPCPGAVACPAHHKYVK